MLAPVGAWSADGHPPPAPATSAVAARLSTSPGSSSPTLWPKTSTHSPSTEPAPCRQAPSSASESAHPSSVLALLNPLAKLRQLRRPQRRRHTLAPGNRPLCGHSDASRHRLIQGIRALGRRLHSSEYKPATQFSKLVPPRLVPRVRCTCVFGGSNHVQAGTHERIERDPIVITVRAQRGLPVRDLAISAQRDVR
ncbi:hypothetical protein ERJ75_001582500 [Trypanosoma vivax]|nr:hypothetical protein TRVL_05601 [Trypanosoma vivax]KAH8605747.1 hypothetical protein ERJ75_001582500 [Trypanosoma vivax]